MPDRPEPTAVMIATAKITAAWLSLHPFATSEVAALVADVHRALTGLVTPHNGFVSLALQSGIAVALLLLSGLGRILLAPAAFGPFLTYSALFLIPSLMFEELSVNQYFLFFMGFILASLALPPDRAASATGQRS